MRKIKILGLMVFFGMLTVSNIFTQISPRSNQAYEQRLFELINNERANRGLVPFIWQDTMASVARSHSEDMLRNNSVTTTGSDGSTNTARMQRAGLTNSTSANILVSSNTNTPEQRFSSMMSSDSNRERIMGNYTHIGIGAVEQPSGSSARIYWTIMVATWVPTMTASDIQTFEYRVFELSNVERVNHGLAPLVWHDTMALAARVHSEDLMRNAMIGHTGSDGSTPSQRLSRIDPSLRYGAENVTVGRRTPEEAVTAWMNSPGHRANILRENVTHLGVGFVQRPEGFADGYINYITQVFGSLR